MKKKENDLRTQIIYDYYKQQREEFIHLAKERTSLTLQFLIIFGALGAASFQTDSDLLKLGIIIVMVLLGFSGYLILINIEKTIILHIARARAARKHLGFLEEFSDVTSDELKKWQGIRRDRYYYRFVFILVVTAGVVFILTIILK